MSSGSSHYLLATTFCCTALLLLLCSPLVSTIHAAFSEEIVTGIAIKRVERSVHLHFYFHDILSGKNPSAVRIAGPADGSIAAFGNTMAVDDPLTEGPEASSKVVGKAQGLYSLASRDDFSLLMVMNFAFTQGRNPIMDDQREMPIVGGCGVFKEARGYVMAHTYWVDSKTGDAIVEYDAYVRYYVVGILLES
ncbi:Pterocarpan synthase 1 [Linum grandiflorum]